MADEALLAVRVHVQVLGAMRAESARQAARYVAAVSASGGDVASARAMYARVGVSVPRQQRSPRALLRPDADSGDDDRGADRQDSAASSDVSLKRRRRGTPLPLWRRRQGAAPANQQPSGTASDADDADGDDADDAVSPTGVVDVVGPARGGRRLFRRSSVRAALTFGTGGDGSGSPPPRFVCVTPQRRSPVVAGGTGTSTVTYVSPSEAGQPADDAWQSPVIDLLGSDEEG